MEIKTVPFTIAWKYEIFRNKYEDLYAENYVA